MNCPLCGKPTVVHDTRSNDEHTVLRRRRKCLTCKHRFTTYERITDELPRESTAIGHLMSANTSLHYAMRMMQESEAL